MIIDVEDHLAHIGTLRKSGRYPWGSGESTPARNRDFLMLTNDMLKQGMTPTEVAQGFEMTTTRFRALRSIAVNEAKQAKVSQAQRLADEGMSNIAIGKEMGINESSVRSLLAPGAKDKADNLQEISNMLRRQVDQKKFLDVGAGVENDLGITETKLRNSVAILKEEGYAEHKLQIDQATSNTNKTTFKVLTPPGTTYREAKANRENIRQISEFSEDGGRTMLNMQPPINVSSKRIKVLYGEEGGSQLDGTIYVRPGVSDLSLGRGNYAQVRIAVEGTHFLKGMAVYKDDLPAGVDLVFNTNKSYTGNKLDVMKPMKRVKETGEIDEDNPFGAVVRQRLVLGPDGKERNTSAINSVGMKEGAGEEGSWDTWNKALPTQMLAKQSPKLAQQQLDMTYERKQQELKSLKELTNPNIRKDLLEKYADSADSSSVHLRAAALPRQTTQVIMPINSLKTTEVYAPNFKNGEMVALVRYPHGGTFEIPELVVNNGNREARKLLGPQSKDAIGINSKVAQRLSGADFDGDAVVVIPNNNRQIKSSPALKDLKDFEPQRLYKGYEGMKKMDAQGTGMQMGLISNLITDMTVKGADPSEMARAVKHSMVVIDAEKHGLDYVRSSRDHGIRQLNIKYQQRAQGGSSTLLSRANSPTDVDVYKLRSAKDGGPIDRKTGKKVYRDDPESYPTADGRIIVKTRRSKKLAETDDARTLLSKDGGQVIEKIYAAHSNRMKGLANEARIEVAAFKPPRHNKEAKKVYEADVRSLNAKLDLARKNKPLERQAQVFALATIAQKKAAYPDMGKEDLKKIRFQAIAAARRRTGAERNSIVPTSSEWAAIQAGAISNDRLNQILKNADTDAIRKLATPRTQILMSSTKTARARSMLASGYSQAEVSETLGVSLSTLKTGLE